LIVSSILRREWTLRGDVSSMCIYVDKKYLSQQYELTSLSAEYWVYGTIIDVSRVHGLLPSVEKEVIERHVVGKSVRLYLVPAILSDYDKLYFDEDSWSILRDVGIFPNEYKIKMKLLKVEVKVEGRVREVSLYPYRDVEAPEV